MAKNISIIVEPGSARPKIMFADTGAIVAGVTEATVKLRADDIVRVEMELFAHAVDIAGAEGTFHVAHPETGRLRAVKSITFADGEVLEC